MAFWPQPATKPQTDFATMRPVVTKQRTGQLFCLVTGRGSDIGILGGEEGANGSHGKQIATLSRPSGNARDARDRAGQNDYSEGDMAKPKFTRKTAANVSGSHVLQLATGHDFFRDAFGDDVSAMKAARTDPKVREAVWARYSLRQPDRPGRPWACHAFGDEGTGGIVHAADDIRTAQRSQRDEEAGAPQRPAVE